MGYSDKKPSNEELSALAKELAENGVGSKAAETTEETQEETKPVKRVRGETDPKRAAQKRANAKAEQAESNGQREPNSFWDTVNLAYGAVLRDGEWVPTNTLSPEERRQAGRGVVLPKTHLTQPELTRAIEEGMKALNDASKITAYRKVQAGVVEGRFSQYAALVFGHFAQTTVTDRKSGEVVKNKDGSDKTRNQAPEARRLMHVIDAIITEMPEDSEHRRLNDKYGEVVESLRDESGKVDENRLAQAIVEAYKAGETFWTDSREFIRDGEVQGSKLSLADLARAGVISVKETGGGGTKVFVAGGKYLAEAIDNLGKSGHETAAELLRSRTERKNSSPQKKNKKMGSGLSALAEVSAQNNSEASEDTEETDES